MKLKINKACDLSSISVLPPQSRRSSLVANGMQGSQFRSQQSQQSFSQGLSSQPVLFSQISSNSLDEVVTADQRFGSQGRENSAKKAPCLPITNYSREESQMPLSGSSTNFIRKWNSTSVPEHRCQVCEQLEHRLGIIETSLNRFGMLLDSIQSDLMQVNKGTKEVLLGTEGIRQKLMLEDTSLQLLNRGQEDIKASIDGGMKSIADQVSRDMNQDKFQQILLVLSRLQEQMNRGQEDIKASIDGSMKSIADQVSRDTSQDKLQQILLVLSRLPEQMEVSLLRLQNELCNNLTKEIQEFAVNLKILTPKSPMAISLPRKLTSCLASPRRKPLQLTSPAVPRKVYAPTARSPKIEIGNWNPVRSTLSERALDKQRKRKGVSPNVQEIACNIMIESDNSDEEIDGLFSFLVDNEKAGKANNLIEDTKKETEEILRRARRQRRKYSNPIIIN